MWLRAQPHVAARSASSSTNFALERHRRAIMRVRRSKGCFVRAASESERQSSDSGARHSGRKTKLAVVGDVHDAWSERDAAALRWLNPDMVLFVGDFGNEVVGLVAKIAALDLPKAVILGNHDAWYTMTGPKPRKRPPTQMMSAVEMLSALDSAGAGTAAASSEAVQSAGDGAPVTASAAASATASAAARANVGSDDVGDGAGSSSDGEPDSKAADARGSSGGAADVLPPSAFVGVNAQLELLGSAHVGFSSLRVPGSDVAVVGGRPFSKGGSLSAVAPFYQHLYGMKSADEFSGRVVEEGKRVAHEGAGSVVLLAHNGPSGLGAQPYNICGVDWRPKAGDHGDPDLTAAVAELQAANVHVPLVTFGHMHHMLKGAASRRRMVEFDDKVGTLYLNAATVPRVRHRPAPKQANGRAARRAAKPGKAGNPRTLAAAAALARGQVSPTTPTQHHFVCVELQSGRIGVTRAADVWVDVSLDTAKDGDDDALVATLAEQKVLFEAETDSVAAGDVVKARLWDAYAGRYESREMHVGSSMAATESQALCL